MNPALVKQIIIGGLAFIVIGLTLAFGPAMLEGFEATRADLSTTTQIVNNVTRTNKASTANTSAVDLQYALVAANTAYITSVTSNNTGDSPVINTVTTTSANFTGMNGTQALRTLTVIYDYGTVQYYTGLGTVAQMGPTLILLGFIIAVGVVGFMGIKMTSR